MAIASAKRAFGSFASARAKNASIAAGSCGKNAADGGGGSLSCSCRTESSLLPSGGNGGRPGEHLVEDDRRRVEIASPVERLPQDLLGGHVGARARRDARVGRPLPAFAGDALRDAEVRELHDAVAAHEHVLRLDVAMHDAERVERGERAEQLLEIGQRAQGVSRRHGAGSAQRARATWREMTARERLAVDELDRAARSVPPCSNSSSNCTMFGCERRDRRVGLLLEVLAQARLGVGAAAQHLERERARPVSVGADRPAGRSARRERRCPCRPRRSARRRRAG